MTAGETIGTQLRAARERMGLGVVQAAERLHVDTNVIEALESGQFAILGAPVFVRGHLRHYAEMLGEPEAPLQDLYTSMESSQAPDISAISRMPVRHVTASRSRWPLILVAGVLVLAAIIWFAMQAKPA
jgi:cytoskeleton protein RodZ